jgi:hypothetical protein
MIAALSDKSVRILNVYNGSISLIIAPQFSFLLTVQYQRGPPFWIAFITYIDIHEINLLHFVAYQGLLYSTGRISVQGMSCVILVFGVVA